MFDLLAVSAATVLTLVMRPVGAFVFGRLADHFGRRPVLMIKHCGLFAAEFFRPPFVPAWPGCSVVRALFGVGMGGIWGIGSTLSRWRPSSPKSRGFVCRACCNRVTRRDTILLASVVYGLGLCSCRLARHVHGRPFYPPPWR